MAANPIRVPRLNANDDLVKVVTLIVPSGQTVTAGELVAEIESEKTIMEVIAPSGGFVLRWNAKAGENVAVGSVLLWIGESPNDAVPEQQIPQLESEKASSPEVTAKARKLLSQYGLAISDVPVAGIRLTEQDVENYIKSGGLLPANNNLSETIAATLRPMARHLEPLTSAERAMMRNVRWHASVPVPAYLEVPFDHAAWRSYADQFSNSKNLLVDPLLSLIAFRLVSAALQFPRINATIADNDCLIYDHVHLGFAVRTKYHLALVVVRESDSMDERDFVKALSRLQRTALGGRLEGEQLSGATLAFSSLANAGVARHIPVLPPNTSLIVAHSAAPGDGRGTIGATYDHRLLEGDTVARVLNFIANPISENPKQ